VATCGTAFAADHIGVLRRILHDADARGEIIFTFDGDAAGQKAAMRAFEEDQRFVGQTFIAIDPTRGDAMFGQRVERVLAVLCEEEGVRLPGDRRHASRRAAETDGVDVPDDLLQQIDSLGRR